jgi:hypothetical protein
MGRSHLSPVRNDLESLADSGHLWMIHDGLCVNRINQRKARYAMVRTLHKKSAEWCEIVLLMNPLPTAPWKIGCSAGMTCQQLVQDHHGMT